MGKERKKKAKKKTTSSNKKMLLGSTPDINGEFVTVPPLEMDDENGSNIEHKSQEKNNYNVSDLLKKVEDCMDSFNFDLAVKFCERALEIQPENVEVLETAGAVFVETGETDKAKTCFQSSVQISPHNGYSKYMTLGQLLQGQEAVAAYHKGIQLMIASRNDTLQADASSNLPASNTDISMAYCSLAEIYLTDECFGDDAETKCCECCNKAIEYDSTNPEAYQLMASCLLSQQNMDEARKMLEKSLELWQGKDEEVPLAPVPSFELRIATSKLLIEVENYESASGVLEDLIEENDEDPQVWYLLGWMYHITNQDSSCIKACLEKAHKLFTNFGCQDQPMMDHITEILESLSGDTGENVGEENGDVENIASDEEEMDLK